ncbi:FRG domain-containing protein [Halomonas sp. M5N1S17]|uniref:FRG domain-containing protein n=1 Tax=Halomonas alkalisoli TaxID=2907158 RepID=UPI001F42A38A|nr:FRG domain-containing protein [Halomonas alkalisoli]MCE9664346.1 FRG domain-containing protein [Halomonas alkalisoli]
MEWSDMTSQAHCCQFYPCTTARQFLEYLNPLETERWKNSIHVFRGQPDAEFGLVPSAHRRQGEVTAARYYGNQDISCNDQVEFEKAVIKAFIAACDRAGLAIPGDSPQVRQQLDPIDELIGTSQEWPDPAMYNLLAFAQHHGVPTCLLDWTRSSYIAAYFAAASALSSLNDDQAILTGSLAVWALSTRVREVSFAQPPGATSPYLAAQSGLFTVSRTEGNSNDIFTERRLELRACDFSGPDAPFHLQCVTLPKTEAGELLACCESVGVSGVTLFPGYEGIAKSIRDWARIRHKWPGSYEASTRYLLSE